MDVARLQNLLSLSRLEFKDPNLIRTDLKSLPISLAMCKSDDGGIRMKPQDLIINLPLTLKF